MRDSELSNFEDSSHQRPISAAARRNDLEMVELLLANGANPSLPEEGAPVGGALWIAVYQKQPEMAKLLLEHGADPNTAPESSGSAISHTRKDPELRNLLLWYGAREETNDRKELEDADRRQCAGGSGEAAPGAPRNWDWNRWRIGARASSPDPPTTGAAR